jgi:hypothetical protein
VKIKFWIININHVFGIGEGDIEIAEFLNLHNSRCKDQKRKIRSMDMGKIL